MAIPAHALVINPTFDSSLTSLANAAQWESAINYADGQIASLFTNPITINITFKADSSTDVNGHNDFNGQSVGSYATVKTILAAHATSADDATSVANLPISDPTGGGNFIFADAQAKALGVRSANNSSTDGTITFGDEYPYTFDPNNRAVSGSFDLIGIAEHEITEVMGRVGDANISGGNFGVLDLFGYQFGPGGTGIGVLNVAQNQDNNYFCIDGGVTPLKLYNNHSDGGDDKDSAPGTDDSFDSNISSGAAYLEPLTKMRMKPVPTDHCLTHGHERGVDVGPFFVTDSQSAILMQPTQRTLHRPAGFAKTTSVRAVASGQQRAAATLTQRLSVRFGVIRPVSLHHLEPPARPARFARDLWNRIDQRQQLRDVVAVGRRQEGNHRRAVAIGQYMVLGTVFPAIYRARTRFFPPCTARTEAESTKARDQSMAFDRRNRFSNSPCSFVQTPRWFQSRSRRQQLMPLPHPISWGRYSHGMPVLSTNRIPDNAARSSSGGRPRFPGPLRCLGSRGRINSQSSSVTNGLVIKPSMAKTKPYCPINHKHGEVHFC